MTHRIFLVEDHDWAREMMAYLLEMEPDLRVCGAASNAEDALAALPGDADLVVVDIGLPGASGFQLVREVSARWPDLPCIVFSGQPAVEHAVASREAGAVGFVEKGDATGLLALIYETLGPTGSVS